MKKLLKVLLVLLVVAVIGGVAYAGYLYYTVNKGVNDSYEKLERDEDASNLREEKKVDIEDSFTVLILGIDENKKRAEDEDIDTDEFRTDTMILATFDRKGNVIKMVNIPRDTLAFMSDEQAFDKINHAHALNGIHGAVDATENLMNVPVDYYIRVNFDSVVDIVNTLGGVEFDVPFDMEEPNQDDSGKIKVKEGKRNLTGEEALAVVRSRRVDSDFGRGERQMEMVQAIMNKAKSTGAVTKVDDLVEVVSGNVTHNFSMGELTKLAKYFASEDVDFDTTMILGDDLWGDNGAYFYQPSNEHLFVLSSTLREILDLKKPDVNEFENIRLGYWMNPNTEIGKDIIDNYKLEGEDVPQFAQPGFKSQYGDGFNMDENAIDNHEIEGDTDVNQPDGRNFNESEEQQKQQDNGVNGDEAGQEDQQEQQGNQQSEQNQEDDTTILDPGQNPKEEYFPPETDRETDEW